MAEVPAAVLAAAPVALAAVITAAPAVLAVARTIVRAECFRAWVADGIGLPDLPDEVAAVA